jgi:hypothetical protein
MNRSSEKQYRQPGPGLGRKYIDRDIRDATAGAAPFNENMLGSKNFERIEDLL